MCAEGHGGEVASAVDIGVAGHGREGAPRDLGRVEEIRSGGGRVLREDAEEVVAFEGVEKMVR